MGVSAEHSSYRGHDSGQGQIGQVCSCQQLLEQADEVIAAAQVVNSYRWLDFCLSLHIMQHTAACFCFDVCVQPGSTVGWQASITVCSVTNRLGQCWAIDSQPRKYVAMLRGCCRSISGGEDGSPATALVSVEDKLSNTEKRKLRRWTKEQCDQPNSIA